jgi:hypothetical protein
VINVVKSPPAAGGPAAKPIAVGKPLGKGETKNCPPLTAPLVAGPLVPVRENEKSWAIEAGAACDES